jgi:hypothetical protein
MVETSFQIERVRQEAARSLPLTHYDEFLRLTRSLLHGPTFQWLLVDAPDEAVRRRVMQALGTVLQAARLRSSRLPLSDRIADVAALEQRLVRHAANSDVVHVIGRPGWFTAERWDAFNVRRERIASGAGARLVFWLDGPAIELASLRAPDFWAWRGGVYGFGAEPAAASGANAALPALRAVESCTPRIDTRSIAERSRRIAEIRAFIDRKPPPSDVVMVAPLHELGRLLYDLGDPDGALAHWQERVVPFHHRQGDERAVALTLGKIADILQARGQLDEAQRTRREAESLALTLRKRGIPEADFEPPAA